MTAQVAVLIATYNRGRLLGETLDELARSIVPDHLAWEVVVVDNNSTDDTRQVVIRRQSRFPVPLRYVFEGQQGRSAALNTAIASTAASLLLCTDDDVRVDPGWLHAGWRALANGADYVGGPVVPIWEAPPPVWLDLTRADLWGTIAILDYGAEHFRFEDRRLVPLGANMGMRRSLVDKVGGFRADLGRTTSRKVLGQEVPELLARARAAGLHGVYVPAMAVHHHVPKERLTKAYYRRWWMGKGYSKAMFEASQPVTELGLDLRAVPHVGAIPRFMFTDAFRDIVGWIRALLRRDPVERFRHAMRLAYLVGFVRARGFRRRPIYAVPPAHPAPAAVAGNASDMLKSAV